MLLQALLLRWVSSAKVPASVQDLKGKGASSGDAVDRGDMDLDLHPT